MAEVGAAGWVEAYRAWRDGNRNCPADSTPATSSEPPTRPAFNVSYARRLCNVIRAAGRVVLNCLATGLQLRSRALLEELVS